MGESIKFNFGGKTLMKWREPRGPLVRNAWILCFIVLLIIFVAESIKSNGQLAKDFPPSLLFIIFVSLFIAAFLTIPTVRLKESCVTRRTGKSRERTDYNEIDRATVHQKVSIIQFEPENKPESWRERIIAWHLKSDQKVSKIHFELKNQPKKTWINTFKIDEIVVPQNVNLEQVLQIFRDKGVNVIEGQLPS
jgi:hypothetical protein